MAFSPAINTQAYAKIGLFGMQGSGKTRTGIEIVIGLHKRLTKEELPGGGDTPVYFFDTETGSDWVKPRLDAAGIAMMTDKTRAFTDLVPAVHAAAQKNAILIIDSITHPWVELTESYAEKKHRTRGLEFQDWAWLKKQWRKFTDVFVNAPAHVLILGRAGYEYDFHTTESGKKELEKTGVKMKAENETGYEPSLLIYMERCQDLQPGKPLKVWRTATVLKDRSSVLDGKVFKNPTFKDFEPHINFLNLGGKQLGVDTSRNSAAIIDDEQGKRDKSKERRCLLDEIKEYLRAQFPGQSQKDLKSKADLLESCAETRSWTRFETYGLSELKTAKNRLIGDAPPLEAAVTARGVAMPNPLDEIPF